MAAKQGERQRSNEDQPWAILSRGEGDWIGKETMAPAPWAPAGMEATGRISARVVLDGLGLASEYLQEVDGKVAMRSHTVMRWDASRGVFIMHFVTADGGDATILEGRREGDRVIFEGAGPNGPMRQTFDYGADTLGVTAEAPGAASGEWSMLFHGRYSPASGASERA